MLVALSAVSLVASLSVAQLNYPVRARNMEDNYKQVQALSQLAEAAKTLEPTPANHARLLKEYHALLVQGENHTSGDNFRGQRSGWRHLVCYVETFVTLIPYISLALPLIILLPVARLVISP